MYPQNISGGVDLLGFYKSYVKYLFSCPDLPCEIRCVEIITSPLYNRKTNSDKQLKYEDV